MKRLIIIMGVVAGVLAVLSLTKPMWGENLPVDPSVASFLHVLVWFVPPAIAFLFGLFDGKEDGFTWWVPMIGMAIFLRWNLFCAATRPGSTRLPLGPETTQGSGSAAESAKAANARAHMMSRCGGEGAAPTAVQWTFCIESRRFGRRRHA